MRQILHAAAIGFGGGSSETYSPPLPSLYSLLELEEKIQYFLPDQLRTEKLGYVNLLAF